MVKTGKLGIKLSVYAVVAFVLAIFGQVLFIGLLLGVALLVEKDEWTARQCMEALFLAFISFAMSEVYSLFSSVRSIFTGGYSYDSTFFGLFDMSGIWSVLGTIVAVISLAVTLFVIIVALSSVGKVAKGQEAGTAIVSKWAYAAYGKVAPAPVVQQPVPQQPVMQQPMQQPGAVPPPVQPVQPPVQQPQQPVPPQNNQPPQG